MDAQIVTLLGILVAVIGSAWKIDSSIGELRERMAKLEGTFEGFMTSQRKSAD